MKKISDLNLMEMIKFHVFMGTQLGVKYVGDPGFIQRFWKMLLNRITRKFNMNALSSLYKLRPMTFKNIIYLPYVPGDPRIDNMKQILLAIHEPTHSLDIRKYPGRISNWYGQYFTNQQFRALTETSAQIAEGEFYFWYTGEILDLNLDGYLLSSKARELAKLDYRNQMKNLRKLGRGTAFHRAAATAISILKGMGVDNV